MVILLIDEFCLEVILKVFTNKIFAPQVQALNRNDVENDESLAPVVCNNLLMFIDLKLQIVISCYNWLIIRPQMKGEVFSDKVVHLVYNK